MPAAHVMTSDTAGVRRGPLGSGVRRGVPRRVCRVISSLVITQLTFMTFSADLRSLPLSGDLLSAYRVTSVNYGGNCFNEAKTRERDPRELYKRGVVICSHK